MKEKAGAVVFCLLFALLFGGVGAGASWAIATMIYDGVRARDWVLVKADVTGNQTYRYTFDGKTYANDRLGTLRLGGTSDVDDFDERVASILAKGIEEKKPITVWVNPDAPAESMIDRTIRWMFLVFLVPFAVAFGGVGLGALGYLVYVLRQPSGTEKGKGKSRGTRVVSGSMASPGSGAGGLWFFAILWNAISFPIAILAVPQGIANGEWLVLVVLLFPLVGIGLLWAAIAGTIAWLRRGKAELKLATAAPRLGAPVEGHFEFAYGVKPGNAFDVRLVCERTFRNGEDTTITPHWTREVKAKAVSSAAGVRVPFRIDAPSNLPPTDDEDDEKAVTHKWRIEIEPSGKRMATYKQEIPMARGTFDTPEFAGEAPSAFASQGPSGFAPEPAPVRIDPGLEQVLGARFYSDGITDQQKRALAQMTAEQQAKLANFLRFVPTGRKLIITIVCIWIAFEVVPMIYTLVR